MDVKIGSIVLYKTTESEREGMRKAENCNVQKILPAIVTAVWSNGLVNLKVILDGDVVSMWVTSVSRGEEVGQWNYLESEK